MVKPCFLLQVLPKTEERHSKQKCGLRCHCRICYSDTSGPQEDQYPPNIAVKVNHSYCSVPVSGAPRQPWACSRGRG